jgi:FtsZ-binding cell division protein ZapB
MTRWNYEKLRTTPAVNNDTLSARIVMDQAADAIEALQTENDRLTNANSCLINDTVQMGMARDAAYEERDSLQARVAELETGLHSLLDAADKGRMVERGVGGMTIEAQIKRSVYNGVPAWSFEEARALLERNPS